MRVMAPITMASTPDLTLGSGSILTYEILESVVYD